MEPKITWAVIAARTATKNKRAAARMKRRLDRKGHREWVRITPKDARGCIPVPEHMFPPLVEPAWKVSR